MIKSVRKGVSGRRTPQTGHNLSCAKDSLIFFFPQRANFFFRICAIVLGSDEDSLDSNYVCKAACVTASVCAEIFYRSQTAPVDF